MWRLTHLNNFKLFYNAYIFLQKPCSTTTTSKPVLTSLVSFSLALLAKEYYWLPFQMITSWNHHFYWTKHRWKIKTTTSEIYEQLHRVIYLTKCSSTFNLFHVCSFKCHFQHNICYLVQLGLVETIKIFGLLWPV